MTDSDRKPCPFCGSDSTHLYEDDDECFTVECKHCGGMYVGTTEQRAIVGWNNRQVSNKKMLLLVAAKHLLLAATGPEGGPTSWVDTRQRWMDRVEEYITNPPATGAKGDE